MIRFEQDEFGRLVESLRDQPGFITAAVVPPGSGAALIESLRAELANLEIEVAAPLETPRKLGKRAEQLGQGRDGHVFVLRLDEPGLFDSENEVVQFWRELNYQREALGSGTVRTCLLLSEQAERGLALVADDLWDWTTIFRFPEAIQASVRTPADSEALIWSDHDDRRAPSETDLATLRSQWQRARDADLPPATFVESYAAPLFLGLPISHDAEALRLWKRDLRGVEAAGRLPPEVALLVARKMMYLAEVGEAEIHREDLIQGALTVADGTVAILESKADTNPAAFSPGLAAALSASAKLHQDAGRFERALSQIETCLDLLRHLAKVDDETEALVKMHIGRRWALLFLLRARSSSGLSLYEQVESLLEVQDPSLDREVRSNALGAALEIAIKRPANETSQANASLFSAWLMSHDSHLKGPRFDEVLAEDAVSYCKGIETLWQRTTRSRWKRLLIEPLIQEWATHGAACSSVREQLVGWLLHFWNNSAACDDSGADDGKRIRPWAELQWIAVKIFGYRFEPDLLPVFCRYLASLSEDHFYSRHRAASILGFMLRWSYQERSLQPLQEVAADPQSSGAEVEAARALAYELWQVELTAVLRRESIAEQRIAQEGLLDQLRRGRPGLLRRYSPEEFCDGVPHFGIGELAGDPEIPDLSREDQLALRTGLKALIRTGRVRDDDGQVTGEGWIFEAWIPWLARISPRDWWEITTELVELQIDLSKPQWALRQFPVLGIWSKDNVIAKRIEEKLVLATGESGQELRGNFGLLELLRWALHLEDTEALFRCLEELASKKEYTDNCGFSPIPWVLRWVLEQPDFEAAGKRRRAASHDLERRLWFLVEWSFVDRLPTEEALAWCRDTAPLAALWDDLRRMLADQLTRIDDPGALELLLGEGGIADPQDEELQEKILSQAARRQELEVLKERFPGFIEGLNLTHRGTFLSQSGRTEELRQWGNELFLKILKKPSAGVPIGKDLVFKFNREALHHWARLEPEAYLGAAKEIVASADWGSFFLEGELHEAILNVWQDLDPLEAADARANLEARSWVRHTWSQDEVPIHIHTLWDPEFSARPEHRVLRLRWLRSCFSDKDIAQHTFAARTNDMLPEIESIGEELLSHDRQLERALGVSLLAWHPDGDHWLEPLLESDPSNWVRRHAEWAISVCRRDRLGRQLYREALRAPSWLEQQARFEQLVPLILPTFSRWPTWDKELSDLTQAMAPRRRALLIDFSHYIGRKVKWNRVLGRDLEKYCRGENISSHLDLGEKGPPWLRTISSSG